MTKIIYPELSYKIVGILYKVFKDLGFNYQEKYYQRAICFLLEENKLRFEKERPVTLIIENKMIGKHYIDFLIEGKLILEIKKGNRFNMSDIKQVLMYLKTTKVKLGILAYFGSKGLIYKRIVNNQV